MTTGASVSSIVADASAPPVRSVGNQEIQDQANRWKLHVEKALIGWWADVDDMWCHHPGSCFWGRDRPSAELKAQQWVKKCLNDLI
jgi:hypothetical protein